MQAFDGYCRYGSDDKNWIKELDATNKHNCYEQCQTTDGCTAFAYESNHPNKDCALYREGPYTYGNGRDYTTCYIMRTGNLTYSYSYHYNIIIGYPGIFSLFLEI